MRESDGTSWRFSEDVPEVAHLALYVRDAVALEVPGTDGLPPRLDGPVPDRSDVLADGDRPATAEQWRRWWADLVAATAGAHATPPDPTATPQDHARMAREALAGVLPDPPDFAALAGAPELQRAVAATFTEGTRYVERRRRDLLFHDRRAQFPWVLLSGTAERIAGERHVPIASLRGQALVLMVQGSWWTLHSPGVALTSVAAARDRAIAADIVTRVFTSALDG